MHEDDGLLHRCLRCGGFYPAEQMVPTGPLAQAPAVARGRELRDLFVLRLLAAERFARGLLLLLAGVAGFAFRTHQQSWRAAFEETLPSAQPLARQLGVNLDDSRLVQLAHQALTADKSAILAVSAALLAYGLLQVVEGVGLWLGHRWGEYVAVCGTSLFLPFEIYEVMDSATPLKIGALCINLVAVAWLVLSKRLFGVRGGHAAFVASRRSAGLLPTAPATPAAASPAAAGAPVAPAGETVPITASA
jgi:uncharacterized membrane protein (DUF2068 family)